MLSTTRNLIALCERGDAGWQEMELHAAVVLRHGSRVDAEALLPVFLSAPEWNGALVPILAEHGDASLAQRLEAGCVQGGVLREGVPEEVLHCLGYLGHEPAQTMLWAYARSASDWHMQRGASLGLLHLPCRGLEADISRELARYEGENLFPEFLPALAFKTGEPAWLARLVAWGEQCASIDCNGGLVLGVALHGAAGRPHFEQLLWNEQWELQGDGTGSNHWAYVGTRILRLSLQELYTALRQQLAGPSRERDQRHALRVFRSLLDEWLRRPWLGVRAASEPTESYAQMHELLFQWSTPHQNDGLTGLAQKVFKPEDRCVLDFYRMESETLLRMGHAIELALLRGGR
jgi:hypothetical protein